MMSDSAASSASVKIGLPLSRWHIHMINGLSGNQVWTVHCRSKNDDLGEHNITVGAEFTWTFKQNYWGTTLFWCNTRVANHQQHADFQAFWSGSKLLEKSCKKKTSRNCFWTAKDDGIYLKNIPAKKDDLMHKWE
ncbi:hypothetical protein FNV43_RR23120 [Rhamnella rubrinervis]|uniref:S-protein homolog n=1 Tax=Rhamnella rubrinervis TaxID=2594499 RepID=A0A8K0DVJ8_9ROSA|nr:hypothetical protein FNV43_RR23120 [Rhamnella rubrinervis]